MTMTTICVVLSSIIFIESCGTFNAASITNTPKPTPSQIKDKIFQDDNRRLINTDGWQIPMPTKKKSDGERVTNGTTANGSKVNVIISYYIPTKTFLYNLKIDRAFQDRAVAGIVKIESLGELKANNKIFGYTINARRTEENQLGFGYRIYDSDGDGKFETMVTDNSAFQVPSWILKEK